MTQLELVEKILVLVPGASFCVKETLPPKERLLRLQQKEYVHEKTCVRRDFTVIWNSTNTKPCPTQEEIDLVVLPQEQANVGSEGSD